LALLSLALPVRAAMFSGTVGSSGSPVGVIPDGGSSLNTLSSSMSVSLLANQITDISVTLNISGGFNGDLYGYLRGPNGAIAVLVNRTGISSSDPIGYGNTGFSVTIHDTVTGNDIHFYQAHSPTYNSDGQLAGTWNSDGRNVDPASVNGTETRDATLGGFNGSDPNGTWTLVFSDWSTSGDPSTLVSWSLDITAVPEPVTVALGIFGGVAGAAALMRRRKKMTNGQCSMTNFQ
jgi:subtilisin-like proprotein convertase family protein